MAQYKAGIKTKKLVVDAGKKLFFEKGYDETFFKDITKETGVLPSVIAYHFETKEALFVEILQNYMNKRVDYAEKILISHGMDKKIFPAIFALYIDYYKAFKDIRWRRFLSIPVYTTSFPIEDYFNVYLKCLEPLIIIEGTFVDNLMDVSVCYYADNAMWRVIFTNFEEGSKKYTFKQVAEYAIKLPTKFFKYDESKLNEMVEYANKFADELDWSSINMEI